MRRPDGERPAAWLTLVLLVILGLFPLETRAEARVAAPWLVVLLAATVGAGAGRRGRLLVLGALTAAAWPLTATATAPGAAVEPLALLALALVLTLTCRPSSSGSAWVPVLAAVATAVGVWAVYQKLWGLEATARFVESAPALVDRELILRRLAAGRAFAGFATPAACGGYLALALPVTIAAASAARGRERGLFGAAVAVQLAGLACTSSLTAWVALAVAGGLAAWRRRPTLRQLGLAAALLAGALIVMGLFRGGALLDFQRHDHPLRERAGNFRVAAAIVSEHPFKGVGPGGYGESFPRYRRSADNESRHVHNLPLEVGAELGLFPGLAVAALFFVFFCGPLFRLRDAGAVQRGAAVGLAAFAVHNLGDFTAFLPSVFWTACVVRGLVGAPASPAAEARRWILAPATAAALLVSLGGWFEIERARGQQAALAGDHEAAIVAGQRMTGVAPWRADGHLFLVSAWLDAGPPIPVDRVRRHADRAVRLSPVRPAARALRARVRLLEGDLPGAWVDLGQAAALYPMSPDYAGMRRQIEARLPSLPGGNRQ